MMYNGDAHKNNPLDIKVEYLKGVGAKRASVLNEHGIYCLHDLLECLPRRYLDRREVRQIQELQNEEEITIVGEVILKQVVPFGRKRLVLKIHDGSGILEAVWFRQVETFERIFKAHQTVSLSGKVSFYKGWQMVHPDFDIIDDQQAQLHTGQFIPLYPSSQALKKAGLNNYRFRRIVFLALQKFQEAIPESLPGYLVQKYRLFSRGKAYQQMHFPENAEMLFQVQRRFKYEELFCLQLLMAFRKCFYHAPNRGIAIPVEADLLAQTIQMLPFPLTGAQERVMADIQEDMERKQSMNRLIQGDVGSGKTVIAMLALRLTIDSAYQAAFMAPTEILARQHYQNLQKLLGERAPRTALLVGSLKAKEKKAIYQAAAAGEIELLVGTHALIQDKVDFKNLGSVVIDEQHRFGVMQRAELIHKGLTPNVLIMTATPIPRTLALTIYGDLDVSQIDELPPGRQKIQTFWRTEARLGLVYDFIRQHIEAGEQAYVVYPLVEESEKMDLKAAVEAYKRLQENVFPEFKVELLHGRLKGAQKEEVMNAFKAGEVQILVATTVIEVGVDVSNATIMLIEQAERFGLSQLHQLRGRVGRSDRQSYCILMTPEQINEIARKRMSVMEATSDGFVIAEEDLRLRGGGDFFGTRQSGLPTLKYADLINDQTIVQVARKDAFEMVRKDPHLRLPVHRAVRSHFERQFAEKFQISDIA